MGASDGAPKTAWRDDIVGKLQADLDKRRELGLAKYGKVMDIHDGRDWLVEAFEEAMDLCVYLRTAIEKREFPGQ